MEASPFSSLFLSRSDEKMKVEKKKRLRLCPLFGKRSYKLKAFLEEEYLKKQKTVREIAEELEVSPTTISKWLKRHGIKTRDKVESTYLGWERTGWYKKE